MLDSVIRNGRVDDAQELGRVHVAGWRSAYHGLIDQTFLDSLNADSRARWWREAVGRPGQTLSVAEVDRVVEGFCLCGPSDIEGWGEIRAIYVSPDHWGTGLGHRLLAAGELALRDAGFDRALLWVLEQNTQARRFYERQGWVLGRPIRIENIGGFDVTEARYEKQLPEQP
jgi:GNAT superfamily N-acetyltransferase